MGARPRLALIDQPQPRADILPSLLQPAKAPHLARRPATHHPRSPRPRAGQLVAPQLGAGAGFACAVHAQSVKGDPPRVLPIVDPDVSEVAIATASTALPSRRSGFHLRSAARPQRLPSLRPRRARFRDKAEHDDAATARRRECRVACTAEAQREGQCVFAWLCTLIGTVDEWSCPNRCDASLGAVAVLERCERTADGRAAGWPGADAREGDRGCRGEGDEGGAGEHEGASDADLLDGHRSYER